MYKTKYPSLTNYICCSGRIKIVLLISIVVLFIVFAILMPRMGRLTAISEIRLRCVALKDWYSHVKVHIEKKGRIPNTLYELCEDSIAKKDQYLPTILFVGGLVDKKDLTDTEWESLEDPNVFFNYIEFSLYVGRNKWFIKELKSGELYHHILMINDKGEIKKLTDVNH